MEAILGGPSGEGHWPFTSRFPRRRRLGALFHFGTGWNDGKVAEEVAAAAWHQYWAWENISLPQLCSFLSISLILLLFLLSEGPSIIYPKPSLGFLLFMTRDAQRGAYTRTHAAAAESTLPIAQLILVTWNKHVESDFAFNPYPADALFSKDKNPTDNWLHCRIFQLAWCHCFICSEWSIR